MSYVFQSVLSLSPYGISPGHTQVYLIRNQLNHCCTKLARQQNNIQRVPEEEKEEEDRSTLPRAVSLADVHVGSPDQLGGKAKSQKTSRNGRSSRFGEKSSRILTSSLSNPVDTTASPMTTLKSNKATAPVSLMSKHSLSSSKNKRNQSRGHRRTPAVAAQLGLPTAESTVRPEALLNTDYLRQRALFALKVLEQLNCAIYHLQDIVARHLSERDVSEDQPMPPSPVLQASATTELTSRKIMFSTYASSMAQYAGRPLRESGGDLLGDLSEIIFNELAFFHLMQDMNSSAVKQNIQCTNTITAPAVKWTCYPDVDLSKADTQALTNYRSREDENEEEEEKDFKAEPDDVQTSLQA
ncbi:unnamed protein product, partial [Coregonus sp. 'balchen']